MGPQPVGNKQMTSLIHLGGKPAFVVPVSSPTRPAAAAGSPAGRSTDITCHVQSSCAEKFLQL